MKIRLPTPRPITLAQKIVASILDKGLASSTWRDNNPEAYEELLKYRRDFVVDVERTLEKSPRRKKL